MFNVVEVGSDSRLTEVGADDDDDDSDDGWEHLVAASRRDEMTAHDVRDVIVTSRHTDDTV